MANGNFYDKSKFKKVKAKKYLGQHFLKDTSIAEKIAEALDYNEISKVVEIGPGTGVLTQFLIEKNKPVLAFEIDKESIEYLETYFLNALDNRLSIIYKDFLKADLPLVVNAEAFAIIGNFPYNISSQILFKAIENRAYVPQFVGMFQKEVAQRICAKSGNKTYGILSVLTQAFYDAEYLFTVKPEVFNPPPKVDSGVIKLKRRINYKLDCDEKLFFRVVKTAFQQRRKTLRNSLKTFNISDNLKADPMFAKRPEQLGYIEFVELTNKIEHNAF